MHPVLLFDVNGSLYTCTGKSPGVSPDAAGAVASAGHLVVSCIVLDIGDGSFGGRRDGAVNNHLHLQPFYDSYWDSHCCHVHYSLSPL